jgi:tetratricopeptide (TPR) repeat protein
MLGYTIFFAVLSGLFVRDDLSNRYPVAYTAWSAFIYAVIFAGNALYSLGRVTPLIRAAWKFVFPIVILQFAVSGIVDSRFGKHAHDFTTTVAVLSWIAGFALFFPTFRAHFLLGYGNIDRVKATDRPPVVTGDPLEHLVGEITKLRRTTQASCMVAILLLVALVINSYFQVHFEKKDDSWVTVRRLADGAQYEEALAVAHRLVAKDPDSPQTRVLMGSLQLQLGHLHQAESSFTRAYELLPNEFNANLLNAVRKRIDEAEPTPTPTP